MNELFEVMSSIRGGSELTEATKAFREITKLVKETGKAGKITLVIDVMPDKQDDSVFKIEVDHTVKRPKKPKTYGLFFADETGRMVREDPRQIQMKLEREQELREANVGSIERIGRG